MTKVYISSTYEDLVEYRQTVITHLRQMNKDVVAMEDYSASDERPVDRCLDDVTRCDVYIGIFALRFGFVPKADNPDGQSITELEYRTALKLGKPLLIFLLDDKKTPWLPNYIDKVTGDGDGGKKIAALRETLSHGKLAKFFDSPNDLAMKVGAAVANWQERNRQAPSREHAVAPRAAHPQAREISYDLLLTYSDVDADFARAVSESLKIRNLRIMTDSRSLLAETPEDFQRAENLIRQCHMAMVVLSDVSLNQLEERRDRAAIMLRLLLERTGRAIAICQTPGCHGRMRAWNLIEAHDVSSWRPQEASAPTELDAWLREGQPAASPSSTKWVGLPVLVVALDAKEAKELEENNEAVRRQLREAEREQFDLLRAAVRAAEETPISARYGSRRLDWKPFGARAPNIGALLDGTIGSINQMRPPQLRGRLIKLQHYSLESILDQSALLRPIISELLSTGCVAIIDEYSLFHPRIQEAFVRSALAGSEQVALVTVSPSDPYAGTPFKLIEAELNRTLSVAFDRFAAAFDPQCELSIGDPKRLKRWLHSSLPQAVQALREPKPNRIRILEFANEMGAESEPRIGALLYSQGGLL